MRKDELDKAAARIKAAVPDAVMLWDVDGGLMALRPSRLRSELVYLPARRDAGQAACVGDIDAIVAALHK